VISLEGKRAFVTGGGRGIGRATALMLAQAGAGVAVGYRSRRAEADETLAGVRRLRRPALGVMGDLGDPAAAGRAVDDAVQGLGGLEFLIVNHGIWPADEVPVAAMTDAQWDLTLRANLDSVLYVCRAAIPLLPDGGKIVLVSSTAGQRGEAFHADYAATKGAVISFTKSLAVELAPRQINVNCVAPGWVDTEMSATPYGKEAGRGKEEIERTIPLGRVASPEDCAGPIVFLCSDLARHITGEILNVNGGSVLCG
jgi:3-oxoacyl-[acyl-carrier protein] reductase